MKMILLFLSSYIFVFVSFLILIVKILTNRILNNIILNSYGDTN